MMAYTRLQIRYSTNLALAFLLLGVHQKLQTSMIPN